MISKTSIKVAFVNNWGQSPSEYFNNIKNQTPGSTGRWGMIQGVSSVDEADCIVAFDGSSANLCPKINKTQKVILVQREPDHVYPFVQHFQVDKVFAYNDNQYPPHCRWGLAYNYDELKSLKYPDSKNKDRATCVMSGKSFTHGQKLRLNFLFHAVQAYSSKIDVYSSSLNSKDFDASYRGSVPVSRPAIQGLNSGTCQFGALYPYEKSISLENGGLRNFVTRTTEAVLCWTLPMYWGCPNIEDFFNGGYRLLSIENLNLACEQFIDVMNEPITSSVIDEINEARNKVLDEYNVWAVTEKMVIDVMDSQ
jgi:hypothetical protein